MSDGECSYHMSVTESPKRQSTRAAVEGQRIRLRGALVDFSSLIELYGQQFVIRILDAYAHSYHLGVAKRPDKESVVLRLFFHFLAKPHDDDVAGSRIRHALYSDLVGGVTITREDLEAAIDVFVERMRDIDDLTLVSTRRISTRRNYITSLAGVTRALASAGFWPAIGRMPVGVGLRVFGNNLPSLGELRAIDVNGRRALDHAPEDGPMSVVMTRNRARLAALRDVLVEEFTNEWDAFVRGRGRLSRSDLPAVDALARAIQLLPRNYGGNGYAPAENPIVEACFPHDDYEFRTAALLKYISEAEDGIPMSRGRGWGWHGLISACGGHARIAAALAGNGNALAAAHGIVLIDSGFNVQPCDDLAAEPVVLQAVHGRQIISTISSIKIRAGGKVVAAVLPDHEAEVSARRQKGELTSLEVIRRWQEMSAVYRRLATAQGNGVERHLWIRNENIGSSTVAVAPGNRACWKNLRSKFSQRAELAGLHINRQHIRTTVLQVRLADGGLDVAAVALAASHGSQRTTLRHYLNRGWFRSEMDELIRRFQNLLEAILVPTEEQTVANLGVPATVIQQRRERAVETGLGFACAHPLASEIAPAQASAACLELQACANCDMLRFVPSESALLALVLTEKSLASAEEEFIARNPRRWAKFWLPMLALSRATISRLKDGHRAHALMRACSAVEQGLAEGSLALVRPW